MKMQHVTKKLLSLMLALALCIPVFFANGIEAKAAQADGLTLSIDVSYSNLPKQQGETVIIDIYFWCLNSDGSFYPESYSRDLALSLAGEGAELAFVEYKHSSWHRYSYTLNTDPANAPAIIIDAYASFPDNSKITASKTFVMKRDVTGDDTVSGNVPAENSDSAPSAPNTNNEEAAPAAAPANQVTTGGKAVTSTVGGVYTAKSVNGTAVLTAKADVAAAAGLTADAVRTGDSVSFYVCDNYNKKATAALTDAAAALNKKVAAYVNCDLYTITKKGVVTKINTTSENVKVCFGLPESAIKAGTAASVLCITPDGKTVVFEDTDTDARTITVDTNVFGVYAILY